MNRSIALKCVCLILLAFLMTPACALAAQISSQACIPLPVSKSAAAEKGTVRVKIYKSKLTMAAGDTVSVRWNLWYKKKYSPYRVTSSNDSVATASISGAYISICAKSAGKAKIILKSGSKKATCTVTVKGPQPTPVPTPAPLFPIVEFGHYEQDNNLNNGAEPIEWYRLEQDGERTLLISRYCLDSVYARTPWSTSNVRKWLNGEFLSAAFTAAEQAAIVDSEHVNYSDETTVDKVFHLTSWESRILFISNAARVAQPTAYAVAKGAYRYGSGNCWWWLRNNTYVADDGSMYSYPDYVGKTGANRPAIWVDLSKYTP